MHDNGLTHSRFLKALSNIQHSNQAAFVIISILIAGIVAETALVKISNYIGGNLSLSTDFMVIVFIIIVSTFVVGQYFIFQFLKQRSTEIRNNNKFEIVFNSLLQIIQYGLSLLLILVILQLLSRSYYNTIMLTIITSLSYSS